MPATLQYNNLYIFIVTLGTRVTILPVMETGLMLKDLGNWEAVNLMLDKLDSCILKHLLNIKVSLESKDYAALKIQLHSLKGAAMYTHCKPLEEAAEKFKADVECKDYDSIKYHYPKLLKECIELRKQVKQYTCRRDGNNFFRNLLCTSICVNHAHDELIKT